MRTKKRSIWLKASLAIVVVALLIRLWIGLTNASRVPDNPLGLTGFDAAVIGLLLALILVALGGAWVNGASARLLGAVRRAFPDSPVYLTTVLPHLVEEVRAHGLAPRLKENTAAAVVFSKYECGWWRNAHRPVRVGAVISDEPIEYTIGATEHFGRQYVAIIATIRVGGAKRAIPIGVVSETTRSFVPKWAVGEELTRIEAELRSMQRA